VGRSLTMGATDVLTELERRGVELAVEGDRLRFRPRDAVPPELRAAMAAHKADLLRLVEAEEREIGWRAEAMGPQVRPSGPIPFLVARRAVRDAPGACLSCGEPLPAGRRFRCGPCAAAAHRVLRAAREGLPWVGARLEGSP
jgi:hypothetical protein